jgi:phenylacetic acid degradation operon negative regulatory protein
MSWEPFHHPDWSLPVVKRRMSEHWIDLMNDVGDILRTNGRSLLWNHSYPSQTAFNMAMTRLKKSGLVVQYRDDVHLPLLKLTDAGRKKLPPFHNPTKQWETKWDGIWYVIIFDVPESERHYRDSLRRFLKKLHMGCLQKSVWVTPRDIRPEYDDLEQTANVHAVSYLFEARTVLQLDSFEIVENAWNFDRIWELHDRYLSVFSRNLELLKDPHSDDSILLLLNQEAEAYVQCMQHDPLLPSSLLPRNYLGKKVYKLHCDMRNAIASALLSNNN